MDSNSKIGTSFLNNDSISGATKYQIGNMPAEEIPLLRHVQKGISEATEENIAFTKEITNLLSKLNLEVKMLPNDIKEGLEKLSAILKTEKLSEFDEIALRVARERRIIEEKRQQREENQMSLVHDKLLGKCTRLYTKLDYIQEAVNLLENAINTTEERDDLYCNKMFLSTKLKEYEQTVERLEADLDEMQVDEIYPEKILDKYKLYLEKKGKLADLNQTLDQYHDLPPNLLQAKILLEEKRKENEKLEQMLLENTEF